MVSMASMCRDGAFWRMINDGKRIGQLQGWPHAGAAAVSQLGLSTFHAGKEHRGRKGDAYERNHVSRSQPH